MIKFRLYLLALAALLFTGMGAYAQAAKAEAGLQQIIQQYHVIGLSVAVVKNNKLIYTHAFGMKDTASHTPLTTNDLFRIASISKSFSATSIMQLVAAKKLSLDDDFGKLVGFKIRNPNYPDKVITLKMVMSHTSSINDSQGYFNLDVINPDKNPQWAKCYNSYEPGAGYQYCNLNYNMVGAVIERTSGMRIDNYVVSHILRPLGLYGGYCVDSLDASRFVTLYEYNTKTGQFTADPAAYAPRREELKHYVLGCSTPVLSPTGGMKITAADLARYMMMHMNYGTLNGVTIIPKKYSKIMQTQVADKDGYGLAIRTVNDLIPGKVMKGHTGSAYGLYSSMFFQPEDKFGFVVITNGCATGDTDGMNPVTKAAIVTLYNSFIK